VGGNGSTYSEFRTWPGVRAEYAIHFPSGENTGMVGFVDWTPPIGAVFLSRVDN